jgi:3,4-dihydroxy 2-butanone 4-phosphate synthase/GTP cyclohydrolase II
VFRDVLGDSGDVHIGELQRAMDMIGEAGRGVVVLIREPWMTSLSDKVRERVEDPKGIDAVELRDYGVGAQILLDLGVRDMILLSNSNRHIVGLEGYGLRVVERRPIPKGGD